MLCENKHDKTYEVTIISRSDRILRYGFFTIYLVIIFYITILIRDKGMSRVVNLIPFGSYYKAITGNALILRQVILNVALFIPYGWLTCSTIYCHQKRRLLIVVVIIMLATSILVESLQYITYRGQFDVDDLISNTVGGTIGIIIFLLGIMHGIKMRPQMIISLILILVGFAGYIYTVKTKVRKDYTQLFDFRISSISQSSEMLEFKGTCRMYERDTPSYSITLVQDNFFGSRYEAEVEEINNHLFEARVPIRMNSKYEVLISFDGYPQMSTGIWLRVDDSVEIEYIPGDVKCPESVPQGAILKAYSEQYDTYVFEVDDKILWLIGKEDLGNNNEIIFHIYTDESERLPEKRIQYGFDNRGFRVKKDEMQRNEIERIGRYRAFIQEIPTEYHITAIFVGINIDGIIVWHKGFRLGSLFSSLVRVRRESRV